MFYKSMNNTYLHIILPEYISKVELYRYRILHKCDIDIIGQYLTCKRTRVVRDTGSGIFTVCFSEKVEL